MGFMETIEHIRDLPGLGGDTIHVWGIHVPDALGRLGALRAVLDQKEREKAARFRRDADRHASIVARGALRTLLSAYTELAPREIQINYMPTGKPFVASSDIEFNVSHSGDWVVIALGRGRNIGVDVERVRREIDVMGIAARYFTPAETGLIEQAEDRHAVFFALWSRKEAYVKARGSTLFRELSSFAVPIEDAEVDGWFFHGLEAGSKHAAAVVTDKPLAGVPCYDFGGLKWDN